MGTLLIVNARLINEGSVIDGDILISGGRIEHIGTGLSAPAGAEVVDAAGKWLMPGMIDDQVHFREPGLTHKGDMVTESSAAVAGGITSFMEMPNVIPPTTDHAALEDKYTRAAGRARANYAFYLGASNDNLEQIKSLDPRAACGIKIFMGASTGNMLVDQPAVLEGIFSSAPTIIVTHCEDTPMIARNEALARERYGDDVPVSMHPQIRDEAACYASSSLAVSLARRFGARLHVLHLTTARELELFAPGPMAGKRITAEACVHHLHFAEPDYATLGNLIKCNPAIKKVTDRDALVQAVVDGRIDVIATDHAPHTAEEKARPYLQAPSGLPLVQHALLALFEKVHDGVFSPELVVEKVCHAPATLFDVRERGFLREGYWADLVLVDPVAGTDAAAEPVLSKCGWSPFAGTNFRSRITMTLVNGAVAYRDGIVQPAAHGMRLAFDRQ